MTKYKHTGVLSAWVGQIALAVLCFLFAAITVAVTNPPAVAQTALPSRMLIGTNPQSVQALTIERCATMGWAIEQMNSNQTVCSHEASTLANLMLTPNGGAGRAPQWLYVVTAAQIPGSPERTLVTIDLYGQAYTFAGGPGQRYPMTRESRRQAENALRSLAERLCTEPCS